MSYWVVPPEWFGETCVILAGGPSLRGFDASCLQGCRVIVINDSYRLCPYADVLYFADESWWRKKCGDITETFRGRYIVTVARRVPEFVKQLRITGVPGFDPDPGALRTGSNSGYQAIHLAAHFGAKRIILLGYDMRVSGQSTHWHEGHGKPAKSYQAVLSSTFLPKFKSLVGPLRDRGVEVINATEGSALTFWPSCNLKEALVKEEIVLV